MIALAFEWNVTNSADNAMHIYYICGTNCVYATLSLSLSSTVFSIHRNCIQFQKFYTNTYDRRKYTIEMILDGDDDEDGNVDNVILIINDIKIDMIILRTIKQQRNFFLHRFYINSFQFH